MESSSSSTSARALRYRRRNQSRRLPPHPAVLTAKFSNNGNFVFAGGEDVFLTVWDYRDATITHTFKAHNYSTNSEIRDVCSTNSSSTSARALRYRRWNQSRRLPPPDPAVLTAKFSNNGNFVFAGGEDVFPTVWDYRDATITHTFESQKGSEIRDVCSTKDDSKMAYCHGDGTICYTDFETATPLFHIEGHKDGVNAVKFTEFGSVIVAADTCVRLWDCRSPTTEPIQIINTFSNSVTSLCLRRSEIFAGSLDGSLQLFDLRNNKDTKYIQPFGVYKGHTCESSKVGCCFTHGCSNVVAGSEDGRVFMWNFLTGDVDAVHDGHSSAVTSVDYHPTDDSLLSASMDGSIVLRKGVM